MQYHYIQELDVNKEVVIKWICSTNILADRFTKSLSIENFKRHRDLLGMS